MSCCRSLVTDSLITRLVRLVYVSSLRIRAARAGCRRHLVTFANALSIWWTGVWNVLKICVSCNQIIILVIRVFKCKWFLALLFDLQMNWYLIYDGERIECWYAKPEVSGSNPDSVKFSLLIWNFYKSLDNPLKLTDRQHFRAILDPNWPMVMPQIRLGAFVLTGWGMLARVQRLGHMPDFHVWITSAI